MVSTAHPLGYQGFPRQRLVGRDREQELLRRQLDATLSGYGIFVLVGGEAGIGKTALSDALCQEALVAGALVLTGHCFDLTTTPPYGPWLDLLSSAHDEAELSSLPESLADPSRLRRLDTQAELFAQVWASVAAIATRRPVVLILEDLHWADVASLDLLRFIARNVSSHPVLLLVTYRVDDLTRRHPLFQLLPALVRETRAVRVDLKRLDSAALQDLIRSRYRLSQADESRLAHYLERHSEGNPFYAGELLRAIEEESILSPAEQGWVLGDLSGLAIPPLVLQVIETRLSRLPEQTRHLLAVAAVIGQEIPLDTWASVSETGDEELAAVVEQAGEAHVLTEIPGGSNLRFAHALVREALYSGIVLPRRRIWHRRTAEVLASQHRPDPDLVAYHFQQAADPRAAEWLIQAGEKAQSLYAPHAAIDRFTIALNMTNVLDHSQQRDCYRARGLAYETTGEFAAAQADYEAVLELARNSGDQQAEWQTLLDLGMLWASRDYTRTGEYYQQALEMAREVDDPPMIARSLNRLGNWHMNIDQPDVAQRHHQEALATFRALNDRRGTAETLDFLGTAMSVSGDLRQTAACFDEAIELFREFDDRQALSNTLGTASERGGAIGLGGLVPDATLAQCQIDAQAALQLAREIGWRAGEVYALMEAGIILSAQGEFGRASEALHRAKDIANEIEHRQWLSVVHAFLGDLYHKMLALPQAREHCEHGIAFGREVRSVFLERLSTAYLALTLIRQGKLDDAGRLLDTISDAGTDAGSIKLTQIIVRLAQAELALAQRRTDFALRIVEQLLPHVPNAAPDRVPLWPAIIRGEALTALGRWDEAEADLRAAIRDTSRQGAQPLLLRAHLALRALYQSQGRSAAADRESAEAHALIERLAESIPDAELRDNFRRQADSLSSSTQASRSRGAGQRAFGLSSREVEVLRLVSEGLTDAEVAERLYISRRTVTSHLTSIYNKLGVSTRTAAAHLAAEHEIIRPSR